MLREYRTPGSIKLASQSFACELPPTQASNVGSGAIVSPVLSPAPLAPLRHAGKVVNPAGAVSVIVVCVLVPCAIAVISSMVRAEYWKMRRYTVLWPGRRSSPADPGE
mmetsp:Transcript_64600/g.209687  ORF Transcript_64600/g.209687 Transcript_64600/m.209687 type:complete len:108 (+) Transcript_64600:2398-2721(+)